jgi:starch phosphorylase
MATIAYMSMEIGLDPDIPTYSGGLGMLAGDAVRAAADLRVPMVAVTLLYRQGYFYQRLDESGWQMDEPVRWDPSDHMRELPQRVSVRLDGRDVLVRAWTRDVVGVGPLLAAVNGHGPHGAGTTGSAADAGAARGGMRPEGRVPVLFLDTDLAENDAEDRAITGRLYAGDSRHRLRQEAVLGIAGVRMLRALGYQALERFHMNEGHAALLTAELLREEMARRGMEAPDRACIEAVRRVCVFTTHTPVAAGHDSFDLGLVRATLGTHEAMERSGLFEHQGRLHMTYAALNFSRYVNGVAKKHGEVSREMFPAYWIDSITNGVHAATWTHPRIAALLDEYIPDWRLDNSSLRSAIRLPKDRLWEAHQEAKRDLVQIVNRASNAGFEPDVLTIGCCRRMTAYKRTDLILSDLERLARVQAAGGPLQLVFAGKAHPHDHRGKEIIQGIVRASRELASRGVRCVFLENYDFAMCRAMVGGCDVWLNTPEPPLEASGTSGMKAAMNGVPQVSVLDGWWIEGCIDGVTGWSIGSIEDEPERHRGRADAATLYDVLERSVVPLYYRDRGAWLDVMRSCISINGSFFTGERMMQEYVLKAYFG